MKSVVLMCEGYNNEGASDMLYQMWGVTVFVGVLMRWFLALSYSRSESDSFATGFRLLVSAQEEVVLEEGAEILAEVFVGVQCCLGQSRAVQT